MTKLIKTSGEVAPVGDLLREITKALDDEVDEALAVRVECKSLFDGVVFDAEDPSLAIGLSIDPSVEVSTMTTWAMFVVGKSVL